MADVLPQGQAKVRAVREMFDAIAPRYDLVNRIMTFRMDVRWRRRTVRSLGLARGSRVLDVACGTGDLCRGLAVRPRGLPLPAAVGSVPARRRRAGGCAAARRVRGGGAAAAERRHRPAAYGDQKSILGKGPTPPPARPPPP